MGTKHKNKECVVEFKTMLERIYELSYILENTKKHEGFISEFIEDIILETIGRYIDKSSYEMFIDYDKNTKIFIEFITNPQVVDNLFKVVSEDTEEYKVPPEPEPMEVPTPKEKEPEADPKKDPKYGVAPMPKEKEPMLVPELAPEPKEKEPEADPKKDPKYGVEKLVEPPKEPHLDAKKDPKHGVEKVKAEPYAVPELVPQIDPKKPEKGKRDLNKPFVKSDHQPNLDAKKDEKRNVASVEKQHCANNDSEDEHTHEHHHTSIITRLVRWFRRVF